MNRASLPETIIRSRLIAVVRGLEPDRISTVIGILEGAGIGAVEVTMDSPGAAESIAGLAAGGRSVGAGTVMTLAEASEAVAAGATFLVAPHTDRSLLDWAVDHGIPMIPGAFTPTEVMAAWSAGAAAVKIFPASVGGPGLVEALRGTLGGVPLIPTGGITAGNAGAFLGAGAVAVGVGSWLTGQADLEAISRRAEAIVAVCRR